MVGSDEGSSQGRGRVAEGEIERRERGKTGKHGF